MEIKNYHIKGSKVKPPSPSPNHSKEFKAGDLDTVIVHYTAGPSARSAINTLTNPRVRASAHLVVALDGSITQLVPFNLIAWHAGRSEHKGRTGLNSYSIGIEIVNAGPLTKSGDVFRAWFGGSYKPSEVIHAVHRNERTPHYWHVYTQEQIETVTEICRLLIETYDIKYILGHEEITSRKRDPGPAFPLEKLRDSLLSAGRDENGGDVLAQEMRVNASRLNIRSAPGGQKVALPLERGKLVKVLEQKNGWARVETTLEGWVSAQYLKNA